MERHEYSGVDMIADERIRQKSEEGWDDKHDDRHTGGELARAAACYAAPIPIYRLTRSDDRQVCLSDPWPDGWDLGWDKRKKHSRIRQLVIAGALIAAEIDRLKRAEEEK